MKKKPSKMKLKAAIAHHQREVEELRADRKLAVAYLKLAIEELDTPQNCAEGLLALRTIAEAYGDLAAVANDAGITREALYRALSPKGNPTLRTLVAALKAVGMRLSVEPQEPRTFILRLITGLGGFLGRKSDGEPGAKTLWIWFAASRRFRCGNAGGAGELCVTTCAILGCNQEISL